MNEDKIYPSMVIRSQAEAIELLEKENQQLKDRIDKAIEMIGKMTEKELNDIAYKGEHYLVCGSDFGEGADIILDILKGDKE